MIQLVAPFFATTFLAQLPLHGAETHRVIVSGFQEDALEIRCGDDDDFEQIQVAGEQTDDQIFEELKSLVEQAMSGKTDDANNNNLGGIWCNNCQ